MSRSNRKRRPNPQSTQVEADPAESTTEAAEETQTPEATNYASDFTNAAVKDNETAVEVSDVEVDPEESDVPEEPAPETTVSLGPVKDWTTEQLISFLRGDLQDDKTAAADVVAEYRRRETLEPAWSTQQVLTYFREGVEPDRTERSGVWVTDVTRMNREPTNWSDAELEAWAFNEIDAKGKATPQTLAAEARQRFNINISDPTPNRVKAELAQQRHRFQQEKVSPAEVKTEPTEPQGLTEMNRTFIDDAIERYAERVKPRMPVTKKEGRLAQQQLDRMFRYILNLEGPAMLEALERFKEAFKKHRDDVFSPSYIYRYTDAMALKPLDIETHNALLELFLVVTDPIQARRKQIDMRYLLRGFKPDISDMLHDYFANHA